MGNAGGPGWFNGSMNFRALVVLVLGVCVSWLPARAAHGEPVDRWYIVEIDGQKAGWAHESEEIGDRGAITSTSELRFKFQRMGQDAETRMLTRYVESAAGDLAEMSTSQSLGSERVNEHYTFIRGIASYEVRRVTETVAGKKEELLPWPEGEWLSPGATRRLIEARLAEGAETISYRTLDASVGLTVVNMEHRVVDPHAVVEAAGKVLPAVKWEVTNSLMPGIVGRDFVDERGVILRSELNFGGMKMVMLASEKEAALSDFSPPEMMAQTLVRPEGKPILNARGVKECAYILSLSDNADMPDLPSVGGQRVERLDAKRLRVTVQRSEVSLEEPLPESREHPTLKSSTMITSDDPWVRGLAAKAGIGLPDADDERVLEPLNRALMQRAIDCVRKHIEGETLGVGFATAAEVARTGRGDCTEYAVLLAAILRAARVPTRVVSGLVHVNDEKGAGVFGYHMWTQCLASIEPPTWVDIDAAILPTTSPVKAMGVDATHIALATSTMSEGDMINSMAALVGLLGRLRIEVVEAN